MATDSVKLLAVITILLAVFAQHAVAKTHSLNWEVSTQSTSHLLTICIKELLVVPTLLLLTSAQIST